MAVTGVLLMSLLWTGALSLPPYTEDRQVPEEVSSKRDHELPRPLPSTLEWLRSNFKFKYVGEGGVISNRRHSTGYWFEVAATVSVSELAHQKGAEIISKMTKHMPSSIFARLATDARAGIFTKEEHLTVYPEYKSNADTYQCHNTCSGSCKDTCAGDGRKFDSLPGLGGRRTVILDDNILCNAEDPSHHIENVLVHQFTLTVHSHALSSTLRSQISSAYNHARSHHTWSSSSYAMSNVYEYFAEAAGTFFNAEHMLSSAGGMNMCSGSLCPSEQAMRENLRTKDPQLFAALSYVFTSNQPFLPGEIGTCV